MSIALHCDQAIFTSVPGPMAQGYRIVAASKGLRPEEKQAITKMSPSHDALCWQPADEPTGGGLYAMAYFELPTGRVCLACSCYAGAEHTGRGGHRVYTHNLVFDEKELTRCAYNPFHVLRGMMGGGLMVPQLGANSVLSDVDIQVDSSVPPDLGKSFCTALEPAQAKCALGMLLDDGAMVVPVTGDWAAATEVLLLGLPGDLRMKVSFAAGLRFALSRCHRVHVLCDEKHAAKTRITGQPIRYLDGESAKQCDVLASAWFTFVERHWKSGDAATLARRTSVALPDSTDRERAGGLYNTIDAVPQTATGELLRLGLRAAAQKDAGVFEDIRQELLGSAQRELVIRVAKAKWSDVAALWSEIAGGWLRSGDARRFLQPVIVPSLRCALNHDILVAAEAGLVIADAPASEGELAVLRDNILRRLLAKAQLQPDDPDGKITSLCVRWRTARPTCEIARQLPDGASPRPCARQ